MSEKFGTEAISGVCLALIELGHGIEKALEDDNRIRAGEALSLAVKSFPDVYRIAKNGADLKNEWADFSEDEKMEVAAFVADKLDLEADSLEAKIEQGFKMLMEVDTFLRTFKPPGEEPTE